MIALIRRLVAPSPYYGVADTKIVEGAIDSNSSNFIGQLSLTLKADGNQIQPRFLYERSPLYMAPICGTVTCDSHHDNQQTIIR